MPPVEVQLGAALQYEFYAAFTCPVSAFVLCFHGGASPVGCVAVGGLGPAPASAGSPGHLVGRGPQHRGRAAPTHPDSGCPRTGYPAPLVLLAAARLESCRRGGCGAAACTAGLCHPALECAGWGGGCRLAGSAGAAGRRCAGCAAGSPARHPLPLLAGRKPGKSHVHHRFRAAHSGCPVFLGALGSALPGEGRALQPGLSAVCVLDGRSFVYPLQCPVCAAGLVWLVGRLGIAAAGASKAAGLCLCPWAGDRAAAAAAGPHCPAADPRLCQPQPDRGRCRGVPAPELAGLSGRLCV